jgi:hypothetical protein
MQVLPSIDASTHKKVLQAISFEKEDIQGHSKKDTLIHHCLMTDDWDLG